MYMCTPTICFAKLVFLIIKMHLNSLNKTKVNFLDCMFVIVLWAKWVTLKHTHRMLMPQIIPYVVLDLQPDIS